MTLRIAVCTLLATGCTVAAGAAPAVARALPTVAERVVEEVQRSRAAAGAQPLAVSPELEQIARERAAHLAALPHDERLSHGPSLRAELEAVGLERMAWADDRVLLIRQARGPIGELLRLWRTQRQSWQQAMAPDNELIGAATVTAPDGWLIFVAVLAREIPRWSDDELRALEAEVVERVNAVRRARGLAALEPVARAAEVARRHGADIARRDVLSHEGAGGEQVDARLRAAGLSFDLAGENLARLRGSEDPAATAVTDWMNSRGHRRSILTRKFSHTGVGAVQAPDGTLYLAQVFYRPARSGGR
jgi:uncharacterized protein YkwD